MTGVVFCCIDLSEYTPDFDYDNWIDLFKIGDYYRSYLPTIYASIEDLPKKL